MVTQKLTGKSLKLPTGPAEPSCLFAGRGDHPQRGKWKDGPSEEDIILNLPPEAPKPEGTGKASFGNPTRCTWLNGKTN